MTHEELVEKVAASIYKSQVTLSGLNPNKRFADTLYANEYRETARAALATAYEAMKEPTREMILSSQDGIYYGDSVKVFAAMINASALKPGEK